MTVAQAKWSLAVALIVALSFQAEGQAGDRSPHRIIHGLRYDWPTAIICLENSDARDFIRLLRPRMSAYARLLAVPEGNVLIATMSEARISILLDVVANIDRKESNAKGAANRLPNVIELSLTKPEPKNPDREPELIEGQYTPTSLRPGRLAVYIVTYADIPRSVSVRSNTVYFSGSPGRVDALRQLANAIDVANFKQCDATNGT